MSAAAAVPTNPVVSALLLELERDDQALDELARLLAPRLAGPRAEPPTAQRPLSPADAADVVGLSRTTIYRALRAGEIQGARQILGQWRIDPAALEAWARALAATSTSSRPRRSRRRPRPSAESTTHAVAAIIGEA